jgi:hypothetical protein
MADTSRSLDRAREYWQQHGRSEKWIQQRMTGNNPDYHFVGTGKMIATGKGCFVRAPNVQSPRKG